MHTYTASYRWTHEVLSHATEQHNRTLMGRGVTLLVKIVMGFLLALSLFGIAVAKDHLEAAFSIGPMVFLFAFCLFWPSWGAKWLTKATFPKRKDANALIEWEIAEDTIKIDTEHLSTSEFRWQLLTKMVEVSDGFLLYPQPRLFHWLPFSAFEQPGAVEQVRQFAKDSGIKYQISKG